MPLDNRNLETGTVLRARYKGTERTCKVVHTADGLRYRLDDGREFASPSSAGSADGRGFVQRLALLEHRSTRTNADGADGAETGGCESAEGQVADEEEGRKEGQQGE